MVLLVTVMVIEREIVVGAFELAVGVAAWADRGMPTKSASDRAPVQINLRECMVADGSFNSDDFS